MEKGRKIGGKKTKKANDPGDPDHPAFLHKKKEKESPLYVERVVEVEGRERRRHFLASWTFS